MARKIGSLWKYKKDNKSYLLGNIEVIAGQKILIAVFPNDKKEKEGQPDYNIILSERTEEKGKEKEKSKSDDF